ncbi:MAG: FKBP-type peptidyl-prolyl cis-trans isomerase [Candidatus Bathyarchaeia archaeon]
MPIKTGDTVKFHFTAKLENGKIVESTRRKKPVKTKIGSQDLLPGLEKGIIGLEKGNKKKVKVPPNKGFGKKDKKLIQKVDKEIFKKGAKLRKNATVEIQFEDGIKRRALVQDVKKDYIVVDLNHPLAGHTITFDIEIVDVKRARAAKV